MNYSEQQVRTAVLNACQNSGSTVDEALDTWLEIEGQLVDLKNIELQEESDDFRRRYLNRPTPQSTQVVLHEGTPPPIVRNPIVVAPETFPRDRVYFTDALCVCDHHQAVHNAEGCYGWVRFLWFFSRRCPCHRFQDDTWRWPSK